ncbi:MAG: hypothetical protein AB1641_19270 [Thermodesulfobacteriota bacterium]
MKRAGVKRSDGPWPAHKSIPVLITALLFFWLAAAGCQTVDRRPAGFVGAAERTRGEASDSSVRNSRPRQELDNFSDAFDRFRNDLWEKVGTAWTKEQEAGFKFADMKIENNRLLIQTRTDGFCKGGLASTYYLDGDFDVQIDCFFEPLPYVNPMDQYVGFVVVGGDEAAKELNMANLGLVKNAGQANARLLLNVIRGKEPSTPRLFSVGKLDGTLRLVRTGERINGLYRARRETAWKELGGLAFLKTKVKVGLVVTNYAINQVWVGSGRSFSAAFSNFRINAAQKIIESEI